MTDDADKKGPLFWTSNAPACGPTKEEKALREKLAQGLDCTAFFGEHVNACEACNHAYVTTMAITPQDHQAVLAADWCFIGRICLDIMQHEAIRKAATLSAPKKS